VEESRARGGELPATSRGHPPQFLFLRKILCFFSEARQIWSSKPLSPASFQMCFDFFSWVVQAGWFFHFFCRWLPSILSELHHLFGFFLSSILFFSCCANVLGAGKKHIEYFPWYMDSERCSTTPI
jgi:hypothetical protein